MVWLGSVGHADPSWRLDVSARGIGSIEIDNTAVMTRDAIVPALGIRAEKRFGSVMVGGTVGAGFPAWYGKTDAALSIDHERVLSDGDVRWSIAIGLDAGIGVYYFNAPPETEASDNALIYWGPLARARVQLHVLDVLPNTRALGLVVGANAGVTSARYTSPAAGAALRFEPELEVGLTMRL